MKKEYFKENLGILYDYLRTLDDRFDWELIIVNDGSSDNTGKIADQFAHNKKNIKVYHHFVNMQLGQALRTAFKQCEGDYVITLDIDLSYDPSHIEKLLSKIIESNAHIVIASPYMTGGRVSNVPAMRRFFSKWGNRFLSFFANSNLHTITSMVRIYDNRLLQSLNLKAMDVEINAEIIYKSMLIRARIVEIPSHLDWGIIKKAGSSRISSMRILRSILTYIISGFTFRPFMFFILPGIFIFFLSLYPLSWAFIHSLEKMTKVSTSVTFIFDRFSAGMGEAFRAYPHTFVIAGIALVVAFQLISLGLIALQNKRYFEDLYYLSNSLYNNQIKNR